MKEISIKQLFKSLGLGVLLEDPKVVTGGLLHQMYQVQTSNAKYAVKRLNPEIMKRETVWFHYDLSERFSRYAIDQDIAGVPGLVINDAFIFPIEEDHYMVFPWIEGICGADKKIDKDMCREIACILSKIHLLDFDCEETPAHKSGIDFDHYLETASKESEEIFVLLEKHVTELKNIEKCINESVVNYPNNTMSHRDLDPKNIIWQDEKAIVIDWEASGPINNIVELLELALSWSNNGKDESLFVEVVKTYRGLISIESDELLAALPCTLLGTYGWLEYNLKRSLGLETIDENDKSIGINQVKSTIRDILFSYNNFTDLTHTISQMS